MNILSYVEKFGNVTFNHRGVNTIDAVIFAQLAYLNFEIVAPLFDEQNRKGIKLKDIPTQLSKKLSEGEFTSQKNARLLFALQTSLRYRDIIVKFVKKSHSKVNEKQFFGITLELPIGQHFISIRGTDLLLYSWKEDLSMAFMPKVPAQETAVEYVNNVAKLIKGEYFIGGHSKGGNLAFYAALNQKPMNAQRCLKAYSFDGQGFNYETKFNPKSYEIMKDRLLKIVPEDCVVGILLNSMSGYLTVKSDGIGVFQHDPFNWKINPKTLDFKYSKRLKNSFINEKTMRDWVNSLTYDETIFIVNVIFEGFGDIDNSFTSLLKRPGKTISNLIKVHYNYSKSEKDKIKSILNRLIYYYTNAIKFYSSKEGKDIIKQSKEINYA